MMTNPLRMPGLGMAPGAVRVAPASMKALLATASLALASCGGGSSGATTAQDSGPLASVQGGQWVVLGSSTAAGVGVAPGEGWVALLSDAAQPRGVTITNLARSGLLSTQALPTGTAPPAGFPPPDPTVNIDAALVRRPTLVLLAFPTNDTVAGMTAAQTLDAWTTIARSASVMAGSPTMVLSTQPRGGLSSAQQATLAEIDQRAAAQFGGCFVALHAALAASDGSIAPQFSAGDGTHLNRAGHELVLSKVEAAIDSGSCVVASH